MPLTSRSQDPGSADLPDEQANADDVGSQDGFDSDDLGSTSETFQPDPIRYPAPGSPTELLPLFPLGTVLVPDMELSLHIFEPRYRQLVADLLNGSNGGSPELGVVALRQGWEVGELKDMHEVGTAALVTDVLPLADGRCNLTAAGRRRFIIRAIDSTSKPYLQAHVHFLPEADGALGPSMAASVRKAAVRHAAALRAIGAEADGDNDLPVNARPLSYAIARRIGLTLADRQAILAAPDTATRLSVGRSILTRECELVRQLHAVPVSAANFRARAPGSGSD